MECAGVVLRCGANSSFAPGARVVTILPRGFRIKEVFSSRDLDFGQRIREATNHEGVDVVIGAQTGQAMHISLSLLRTGGRYIEAGKKDIAEDNSLPLRAFNRNLIFASVD